ncbi:unnamed protein product [Arctogadus glacialis]
MASSDLVKKVIQLKLQLKDTSKSTTLLKTLQKLQGLDVSLDILSETGIGKTVNSLRNHKEVGDVAKSVVRYWKKLVPQDSISNPVDSDTSQTTQSKDGLEEKTHTSSGEKDKRGGCLKSRGESKETATAIKGSKKFDDKRPASPQEQRKEKKREDVLWGSSLERETPQVPKDKSSKFKKDNVNKSHKKIPHEDENNNKHDGHHDTMHRSKTTGKASKCRLTPKEKALGTTDAEKLYEDKESKKKHQNPKSTPEQPVQQPLPSKAEAKYSMTSSDSASEKEDGADTLASSWDGKSKKKKVVEENKRCQKIMKKSESVGHSNTSSKKSKIKVNNSSEADLAGPSMSFESFLSYDTNTSKRKVRSTSKQPLPKKTKTREKGEAPKQREEKTFKLPPLLENGVGMNKVKDNVMDLLNTPLPEFLPECDKFSVVDYYEPKRVEKESFDDAGEKHFTGYRCNKKMQVYSGNKSAFLPSMMSLYQQCIRALQNNIDLLYDTGGVSFEILEPVLERCTPDQLLRIEEHNPSYVGETDHFWGRHCERDFRGARLLEYESWKEMYVRLSEERENKFKRLAKTIVSAHSKKPQGRQVKMAFIHTVAKPPRDVRIQQEMYGTAGAVQPSAVRASVKIHEHRPRPSCVEPPKSNPTNSGTANSQDPRKRTRVAPMMAKSLKAFKKQLGRR